MTAENNMRRWIVFFSASLLFFYTFIQLNSLNAISADLLKSFHLNALGLGLLPVCYFYAIFLFIFPAGLLLDRYSPRTLILIAMLISVIGVFGFASAHNLWVASLSRVIMGIGGAFSFIGCIRIASRWFSSTQMALVAGVLNAIGMLGGLLAQFPLSWLTQQYSWRTALSVDAPLGVFCFIFIFLFVSDRPQQQSVMEPIQEFWENMSHVFLKPNNWLCGLYTALINSPVFVLGALWGNLYLTQMKHLSVTTASYIIMFLFFGNIIGAPLIGCVSDFLQWRRRLMIMNACVALLLILIIIFLPNMSIVSLAILFTLLGITTSAQILSYPIVTKTNSLTTTGLANSIVSMTLIASGFIFQPLFGYLMELSDKPIYHLAMSYTAHDFLIAMSVLPVSFLISMLIPFWIKTK